MTSVLFGCITLIFTDRLSQLLRFVSIFAYITYVTPLGLLLGAFTPAHGYRFNSSVTLSLFHSGRATGII